MCAHRVVFLFCVRFYFMTKCVRAGAFCVCCARLGARRPARPGHVLIGLVLVDPRHGTSPGGKEGRLKAHKHIHVMPYRPFRPIYLWEMTVNKLFIAVAPSRDSSPRLVNGRRARDRRDM